MCVHVLWNVFFLEFPACQNFAIYAQLMWKEFQEKHWHDAWKKQKCEFDVGILSASNVFNPYIYICIYIWLKELCFCSWCIVVITPVVFEPCCNPMWKKRSKAFWMIAPLVSLPSGRQSANICLKKRSCISNVSKLTSFWSILRTEEAQGCKCSTCMPRESAFWSVDVIHLCWWGPLVWRWALTKPRGLSKPDWHSQSMLSIQTS